VVEIQSTL
jgi:hypothetical protein